ncbi:MAG: hypothetical protein ACI4XW_00555 [Candidatus Spyradocola sp.]
MKTLNTIQKTFHVFRILTRIAMILTIVGASLCALGALCAVTWYAGGTVISLFGTPVPMFAEGANLRATMASLLSEMVVLITDAVLLGFAGQYFKAEQADGTPFTLSGAERVKRLGIRCIWMPIVATVIAAVLMNCLGADKGVELSSLPSVATGVVLILTSLIFRYGAELADNNGNYGENI